MRRGVEICKGIIIGLLLLSAALLAMTIIYDSGPAEGLIGRLSAALGRAADQPPKMAQEPALTDAAQPLLISVLGQAERASFWGDFAALDAAYEALGGHLAAALDTAGAPEAVTTAEFARAARGKGVYFRYPGAVPLPVLAAWLDAGSTAKLSASRLFLGIEGERVVLLAGDGVAYCRMETQVEAALLSDALDSCPADGTRLAQELAGTPFDRLDPLALVDLSCTDIAAGGSENPCDDLFLTSTAAALGFNPYGDSKYRSDDGGTVYTESDCTLRVSTDGLLTLQNSGQHPRFSAASASAGDRIEYVRALLQALAGDRLGDGRLQFTALREAGEAVEVEFSYFLSGLPVEQGQEAAVTARFQGAVLTTLRFRVRTYTLSASEREHLLPPTQAAAVQPRGADLQAAYADVGESRLQAGWLS
ncbi:MAG: hypothetical protein HFF17_03815 [Oscillospiraceae bacterium]|nr:hypothetical protein [Oscillospiraceae bacterium]